MQKSFFCVVVLIKHCGLFGLKYYDRRNVKVGKSHVQMTKCIISLSFCMLL